MFSLKSEYSNIITNDLNIKKKWSKYWNRSKYKKIRRFKKKKKSKMPRTLRISIIFNLKKNNSFCCMIIHQKLKVWYNGGILGYSGTRKKGVSVAFDCAQVMNNHIKLFKRSKRKPRIFIIYKGRKRNRRDIWEALTFKKRFLVRSVACRMHTPFNGCRNRKTRRK